MNRDDAVTLISGRLGNRGAAFNATIITELQYAQETMEQMPQLPWFLLNHDESLVTVAETRTVSVPTGFLLPDDNSGLFIIDSDGGYNVIIKDDYETLRKSTYWETGSTGLPEFYALQGTELYLFPSPSEALSLDWFYYKADDALTSNIENKWLESATGVLVNSAGMNLARFLRDRDAMGLFSGDYTASITQMWAQDTARQQNGLSAYLGG